MKSIRSYFDSAIVRNEFKRLYWVPVLYFIGLFIMVPLQILLEIQRYSPDLQENLQNLYTTRSVLRFDHFGVLMLVFVVPVIVGLLLYRYMQNKKNSDMIHSLPIRRETLYISHGITGVLFLLLPLLATTGITWIIQQYFHLQEILTPEELGIWFGTLMLMSLVLYISTVFVGMVTGMTIPQGILTYIVLFLPVGLYQLIVYNTEFYLYGFSWERYGNLGADFIQKLSPIIRMTSLFNDPLSGTEVIGYSLFVIVLGIIGLLLYKQRKLENNLQVIVFRPLKQLFKYGVTFSFMLLAGVYFHTASDGSMAWTYIGYGFFALLGYGIAEAIIQKTVRILSFKMVRGFVLYSAVILLIVGTLTLDVTGFEGKLPKAEEVEGVYIGYHNSEYQRLKDYGGPDLLFHEEENIEEALALHQMMIDFKEDIQDSTQWTREARPFHFVYELENGETLTRHYETVPQEIYEETFGKLIESEEYKTSRYPVLSTPAEAVQRVSIQGYHQESPVTILEPDKIAGILEAIKKGIREGDLETLYRQETWGGITILLEAGAEIQSPYGPELENELHISWSKGFEEIDQWLKEEGLQSEARITAEQVAYMVVEPFDGNYDDFYGTPGNLEARERASKPDPEILRYESEDPVEIEEALRVSDSHWRGGATHSYKVGFYDAGDNQIILESFRKEQVPEFIQNFYR